MRTRTVIGWLSGLGGAAAGLVGAISLTRIAGDHLGFPPGLEWTLTAAVDIGAIAGAVMWSTSPHRSSNRGTGVRLNVACSAISAVGVGLDHATNATPVVWWQITAFLIGAFLPLLSTWLVHALAKLGHGQVPARRPARFREPAVALNEPAAGSGVPEPRVSLEKATPKARGLQSVPRPAAGSPHEWAVQHWPCTPAEVETATGCSRSTAFRAVKAAREASDATAVA